MLKRHEVLFNQLTDYRMELLSLVEDVSEEMADQIPDGFRNNIRWNLGHIYLDQYLWVQHLTKEPISIPEGFSDWFGFGTSPESWVSETPKLDELVELLKSQPLEIKEKFGERLEEEFPPTESGMHTIAQVLVRTIFHEGMHLETIKNIKKLISLK